MNVKNLFFEKGKFKINSGLQTRFWEDFGWPETFKVKVLGSL